MQESSWQNYIRRQYRLVRFFLPFQLLQNEMYVRYVDGGLPPSYPWNPCHSDNQNKEYRYDKVQKVDILIRNGL